MQSNPSDSQFINPSALYRAKDCARFFSIGLSTWWRWCHTGMAMPGVKISPKVTVWEGNYLLELKKKLIADAQGQEG